MKIPKAILFDLGGVLCELRGEAHMMKLLGGLQTREQMWRAWLASPAVRAHESGKLSEMEFAKQVIAEFALDIAPDHRPVSRRTRSAEPHQGTLSDRTIVEYRQRTLAKS